MKVNIMTQPFIIESIYLGTSNLHLFKELRRAFSPPGSSIIAVGRILHAYHWFDTYEVEP